MPAALLPAASPLPLPQGIAGGQAAAAVDSAMESGETVSSFANIYVQLLGEAVPATGDADLLATLDGATWTAAADTEVPEDLAAALPFLEALGIVPPQTMSLRGNAETSGEGHDRPGLPAAMAAISATNVEPQTPLIAGAKPANDAIHIQAAIAGGLVETTPDGGASQATEGHFESVLQSATDKLPPVALQQTGSPAQNTGSLPNLNIPHPVSSPQWSDEVGNRMVWMVNQRESHAELVLTPPHMGRVEVSLTINGDQASASFASANPVVRETLEAALPRLRDVLAEAGIQLGQAQVGAENPGTFARQGAENDNARGSREGAGTHGKGSETTHQASTVSSGILKSGRGLVDVFA